MFQRGIIFAGLAAYLIVTAVVLSNGESPSHAKGAGHGAGAGSGATSLEGLPYRSVGMQIQRLDWIPEYKKNLDKVAALGFDTVLLVIDARQENGKSSKIYLDFRMTPTVDQLGDLMDYAKSKKLRVILMPRILLDNPQGNEWRGTITPDSWPTWWDSYRDMIQIFSSVAEVHHADMLVVGSELVSTEHMVDEWTKTIDLARSNYKGRLTYSSNWDHYDQVPFWDQLDMIGINAYWTLGPDENTTLDQMNKQWAAIQTDFLPFIRKLHKPLMFIEIGYFSQSNTVKEPWNYTEIEKPLNLEVQKRLYEAFFESWWGNPIMGGFSIWEWPPNAGGPEDKGYTPEGKPAMDVLKKWLAKGSWEVK